MRFRPDADTVPLILAIAFLILVVVVYVWGRARERSGDWGPGLKAKPIRDGYLPADLRATAAATRVDGAEDRWLLGLAAPFVEQAGLLHDRWSLVPAFCDEGWHRRLAAVAHPLRATYSDWLRYGDAIIAATEPLAPERMIDLRADLRILYAGRGPWHDLAWPD